MNWRDFGIIGAVLMSVGLIVAQVIQPVEPEYPLAHQGPRSPSTKEYVTDGPSFTEVRALVDGKVAHYREMYRNGDLESFAPDGETADPEYNQAFFALLVDIESGIESGMGFRRYSSREEESVRLIETQQKVLELERRFLAGEDLGAIVFWERADHTVLILDGTYAGRSPKFSPERREITLWDIGSNDRILRGPAPRRETETPSPTNTIGGPDPNYVETSAE